MEVILTHEQADFDALASLLGVSIIVEKAQPVLPARVNRNIRNFLNLYRDEFPFIESRDLTASPIDLVTLVDTQSLITLKGVSSKTRIRVIDHHIKREDLPTEWECQIERVGATTTILVDLLREQNLDLKMIQATLLLLGIYEDTGSLTYATTTVRDVKAAAFLLEKGANLSIASDFLNPALSEEQRKLADRLLENAQNLTIHGKTIFISCAEAMDMNEEISTIAHKLRDLLDPDALFLFVHTNEGMRLVARSTTDDVNVAKVASRFGGGGHERASAALIQINIKEESDLTFEKLTADLVEELGKVIQPAITVGKIMSRKPHLITPSTSLSEAVKLMQRYGYEGYPVVENEQVVGLLTRRAVDRALNHKLNLNAGSLMEAGEVTLKSTDTIDQLQQLMAATGWGQIPVLDPESGRIIGIVTRTDLLKTLPGHEVAIAGQKNYAAMLEKALPPSRLTMLKLLADYSSQVHQAIYIVGGFVRDLILERPSLDFDIVVEGDAIQFARSLAQKLGGRVVSHKRFGTAKWQIKTILSSLYASLGFEKTTAIDLPESLDFISARTEFYDHPTALPIVERSSIKLDLHRRDFTMNTLALRLDGKHYGELYDYWGGLADIEKKQVRVLHSLSFVDDPTRLLRAVRFEQRFRFQIEKRTLHLMTEARDLLHQLSGARIHHEFDLIFYEDDPVPIMERLEELGLLRTIHPKLGWDGTRKKSLTDAFLFEEMPGWEVPECIGNSSTRIILAFLVWLAGRDSKSLNEIGLRLRLSNQLMDDLVKLSSILINLPDLTFQRPSQMTHSLENLPIYAAYALYCLSNDQGFKKNLNDYALKWRFITPHLDGNTLRELGIPPGPIYADILLQTRDAWLDGIINSEIEEKEFLNTLIAPTVL